MPFSPYCKNKKHEKLFPPWLYVLIIFCVLTVENSEHLKIFFLENKVVCNSATQDGRSLVWFLCFCFLSPFVGGWVELGIHSLYIYIFSIGCYHDNKDCVALLCQDIINNY